ncbi:DMT family transporter [Saccharospirillum impatiens]|uniref:DMT family transporter n=1 Tax=Saccharospirillum impatiens TaxID=169438 RepID=UPI0004266A4D|nr:DMT family transporter [Saccharospirillum impatiens]
MTDGSTMTMIVPRHASLTVLALIAFAANSVLCRLALGPLSIDAASFTAVRLVSGAITLVLILAIRHRPGNALSQLLAGSWRGAGFLWLYAACFSFAYVQLDTATGALLLFGTVQLTMIITSLLRGERLTGLEWLGLWIAVGGFLYLIIPGLTAPTRLGFVLMVISGIAWGFYTLNGRGSSQPLADTAGNFVRAAPFALLLYLPFTDAILITSSGFWLAVASGSLASGIGYALWYSVLPALSGVQASVLQLSVPVLAAIGGAVVVLEPLTTHLLVATGLLLGGIGVFLAGRAKQAAR